MASPEGQNLVDRISSCPSDVFPPHPFRALEETPFEQVRAVIFGQDPYHTPGKACGLAFSVPAGEKLPPSLKNIFKVMAASNGIRRTRGDLSDWAAAGVLLLNTILTVEAGKPLAHAGWGWETLTDLLLSFLQDEMDLFFFCGANQHSVFGR